jgi:hypothetical protein
VIIARGALEIRVRFVVGTRRRKRGTREAVRRGEPAAGIQNDIPVWPPVKITDTFIAEHVALAHALRRAAMRTMFLRIIASFKRHSARPRTSGDPVL